MPKRCPHCQTRPLRADADTCWYCGRDYRLEPRPPRAARLQPKTRSSFRFATREVSLPEPH